MKFTLRKNHENIQPKAFAETYFFPSAYSAIKFQNSILKWEGMVKLNGTKIILYEHHLNEIFIEEITLKSIMEGFLKNFSISKSYTVIILTHRCEK